MNLSNLRKLQKKLAQEFLLKYAKWEFLPYFLIFSYLGARICYSQKHPLSLFEEERLKEYKKLKEFLLKLKNAGHHSVFAHTPIYVNVKYLNFQEKFYLASVFFKVFWDYEKEIALFNLRHFSETLSTEKFSEILDAGIDLSALKIIIYKNWQKVFTGFYSELQIEEEREGVFATPEVIILKVEKEMDFEWIGVIVKGFSRIFSHQFVRHTWLNFNQRSHRYTPIDSFVVPESFSEELKKMYLTQIERGLDIYKSVKDVHKESLRFILPQGVSTTLLATGPRLVWEDFVEKRAISQAQDEIRKLAMLLKKELGL